LCHEEHEPLNDEQIKNSRTYHPMQEYHFSLNGKYRNTHFAQNEEQVGILTHTTLYIAPTPKNERGEALGCCVLILTPSPTIYRPRKWEGAPRLPWAPPMRW
jgi:hypothetical protein